MRFFTWARCYSDDGGVSVEIIEAGTDPDTPPIFRSAVMLDWSMTEPIVERAERVCERLNRSTLAVAAAELEPGGLRKLFKHCWEEDERDYSKND